jgi:nitrogen fixation NifU-like protein
MDLYAEHILEHYRHPHHYGALPHPRVVHEETNASCGDVLRIELDTDGQTIAHVGWTGTGCAISQAAMSMFAEEITGKPLTAAGQKTAKDIVAMLGVPIGARRTKCALLCLHAFQNALRKMHGVMPQGWHETIGDGL